MNKVLAAMGIVVVGGGLSLCGLCGTTRDAAKRVGGLGTVAVANAQVAPALTAAFPVGTSATTQAQTKTIALAIRGMTCGGCVVGVRTVLARLPGVSRAEVTYKTSRAVVTYDPARVSVEQMTAAIKTLGYTATVVAVHGAPFEVVAQQLGHQVAQAQDKKKVTR